MVMRPVPQAGSSHVHSARPLQSPELNHRPNSTDLYYSRSTTVQVFPSFVHTDSSRSERWPDKETMAGEDASRAGFLIQCGHFGLEDQASSQARRSLRALGSGELHRQHLPQKGVALLLLGQDATSDPSAIYAKLVASHSGPSSPDVGGNTREL